MGSLQEKKQTIKKSQMKMLQIKSMIPKKNSFNRLISRQDIVEQKIYELERK